MEAVQRIMDQRGVCTSQGHMCRYGMTSKDQMGEGLGKMPTQFMTNSPLLAKRLDLKCQGDHRHAQLIGSRTKKAQAYPDELCRAILKGLADQMGADGRWNENKPGPVMAIDENEW